VEAVGDPVELLSSIEEVDVLSVELDTSVVDVLTSVLKGKSGVRVVNPASMDDNKASKSVVAEDEGNEVVDEELVVVIDTIGSVEFVI